MAGPADHPATEPRKYGWHEGRAFHAGRREDCRTCDHAEAAQGAAPLDLTAGATAIIDDVAARIGPNFDGHQSEGAAPRAEGLDEAWAAARRVERHITPDTLRKHWPEAAQGAAPRADGRK